MMRYKQLSLTLDHGGTNENGSDQIMEDTWNNIGLALIIIIGVTAFSYMITHERSIEDMNGTVYTLKGEK